MSMNTRRIGEISRNEQIVSCYLLVCIVTNTNRFGKSKISKHHQHEHTENQSDLQGWADSLPLSSPHRRQPPFCCCCWSTIWSNTALSVNVLLQNNEKYEWANSTQCLFERNQMSVSINKLFYKTLLEYSLLLIKMIIKKISSNDKMSVKRILLKNNLPTTHGTWCL